MHVLIISEVLSSNLGDKAIFSALCSSLKNHGYTIDALDLTHKKSLNHNYTVFSTIIDKFESFLLRFFRIFPHRNKRVFMNYLRHYFRWFRFLPTWKKKIAKADLILFGGGALLQDLSMSFPLSLFSASKLANKLGCPYVLFAVSCGKSFSKRGKYMINYVLENAQMVSVRHTNDVQFLKKEFGVNNALFAPDPALFFNIKYNQCFKARSQDIIGINVMGEQSGHILLGDKSLYKNYIESLIDFLRLLQIQESPFKILLFATGKKGDIEACEIVKNMVKSHTHVIIHPSYSNINSLMPVFSKCKYIIATRLHAAILSLSFGTPVVGIAYDRKVTNFFEDIGWSSMCIDFSTLSSAALLNFHEKLISQQQYNIREFQPVYNQAISSLKNFKSINKTCADKF